MTARSVSDLAADVPLTRAAADAADAELEAVIRKLNPELLPRLGVRALYVQAVESERDDLVARLEAAEAQVRWQDEARRAKTAEVARLEAQVAALTQERDEWKGIATEWRLRREASAAALADTQTNTSAHSTGGGTGQEQQP